MTYLWEQTDRGAATGTGLLNNTKTNGPLFRQFGTRGRRERDGHAALQLAGREPRHHEPHARVPGYGADPDQQHERRNRQLPVRPQRPPTAARSTASRSSCRHAAYVGFAGVNASPLSLHFRLTARDGRGGVNSAATTLLLATGAGPFLVTSPNTAVTLDGGSTQNLTWNLANTDAAPVSTANVKITLSADGGITYPYTLAASTPNDGSAAVTSPTCPPPRRASRSKPSTTSSSTCRTPTSRSSRSRRQYRRSGLRRYDP